MTQRSVSQENVFKESKNPSLFCFNTKGSNNYFTPIKNNLRFLVEVGYRGLFLGHSFRSS